jgi:protein-tyrosine phosphatase
MSNPPFSVPLEGASNVRDLGGYLTKSGRRVRRGVLFRSAALATLTEADLATLAALDIRVVCDFRGVQERGRAPTRLVGPTIVTLPIEPSVGAGLRDILATKEATGEALHAVLERAYVAYALGSNVQYRGLLDQVLDGGVPLLFHCSAGKDRTGFGAALILMALDVPWEDVVADFQATDHLWRRDTVHHDDLPEQVRENLLIADPRLLEAAFAAARREYGSFDAYLARALDLSPAGRERLRDLLLEPA